MRNNLFTVFESTASKSRINFHEVLQGLNGKYILTKESFDYLKRFKFPPHCFVKIQQGVCFVHKHEWQDYLTSVGITKPIHIRIATEVALLGGLLESNINQDLVVLSDDAGQFNILKHALCWIHAERLIKKLEPINELFAAEQEKARADIWQLYEVLSDYRDNPTIEKSESLLQEFDVLFLKNYQFTSLKLAMKRLYKNKEELLLVLRYPKILDLGILLRNKIASTA